MLSYTSLILDLTMDSKEMKVIYLEVNNKLIYEMCFFILYIQLIFGKFEILILYF